MKTAKIIAATLLGVSAGFAIGILLAPDKGYKTRKKLNDKRNSYLREVQAELQELRKKVYN